MRTKSIVQWTHPPLFIVRLCVYCKYGIVHHVCMYVSIDFLLRNRVSWGNCNCQYLSLKLILAFSTSRGKYVSCTSHTSTIKNTKMSTKSIVQWNDPPLFIVRRWPHEHVGWKATRPRRCRNESTVTSFWRRQMSPTYLGGTPNYLFLILPVAGLTCLHKDRETLKRISSSLPESFCRPTMVTLTILALFVRISWIWYRKGRICHWFARRAIFFSSGLRYLWYSILRWQSCSRRN